MKHHLDPSFARYIGLLPLCACNWKLAGIRIAQDAIKPP
jgi:hypothetical protein